MDRVCLGQSCECKRCHDANQSSLCVSAQRCGRREATIALWTSVTSADWLASVISAQSQFPFEPPLCQCFLLLLCHSEESKSTEIASVRSQPSVKEGGQERIITVYGV